MARTQPADDPLSPLAMRIKHLCENLWEGNMSRMSRDLGVSHPVVSRVIAGNQPPTAKMLEGLARRPGMNLRWLFAGEGELHGEQDVGMVGGHYCPVAATLLPGKPENYPERLTLSTFAVAGAVFTETLYCHRVGASDPVIKNRTLRVAVNDYLLIETSERWTRRPEAFRGRVVAVKVPSHRGAGDVVLGVVGADEDYFADGAPYEVKVFGEDAERRLYSGWTRQSGQKRRGGVAAVGQADLFLDDLVGVCVQLVRVLDRVEPGTS